jgi:hypothetical protein
VSQEYGLVANTFNDAIELSYTPQVWAGDNLLLVAYQSVPKDWIAYPGVDCFIAPALTPDSGINIAQGIFGEVLVGQLQLNPENPRV